MKKLSLSIMLLLVSCLLASTALAREDVQRIPVRGMKVFALDDRANTPQPALFPGLAQDRLKLIPSAEGSHVFRTYLVRTPERTVLIDTGFGRTGERRGKTIDLLARMNIRPQDITDIILTHLDGDHILGLSGGRVAAFPKAVVRLSQAEYEGWIVRGDARAAKSIALARNVLKLYNGRVKTFRFDEQVLPGIIARDATGHTVGHAALELGPRRELVIVGDLLHVEPLQLSFPAVSSVYDADKQKAAAMREAWLARIAASGQIMAGMHIRSIGRVSKDPAGGYTVTPLK